MPVQLRRTGRLRAGLGVEVHDRDDPHVGRRPSAGARSADAAAPSKKIRWPACGRMTEQSRSTASTSAAAASCAKTSSPPFRGDRCRRAGRSADSSRHDTQTASWSRAGRSARRRSGRRAPARPVPRRLPGQFQECAAIELVKPGQSLPYLMAWTRPRGYSARPVPHGTRPACAGNRGNRRRGAVVRISLLPAVGERLVTSNVVQRNACGITRLVLSKESGGADGLRAGRRKRDHRSPSGWTTPALGDLAGLPRATACARRADARVFGRERHASAARSGLWRGKRSDRGLLVEDTVIGSATVTTT